VVVEEDQFALVMDSEGPEDDGVHHGENGGIRADPQSQRNNRSGGKARAGAEATERQSQIVAEQHRDFSRTLIAVIKLQILKWISASNARFWD
jgi:hypothetical protein